jgi:hypothetical protein
VVASWQPLTEQLAAKIGKMSALKEMVEGQPGHGSLIASSLVQPETKAISRIQTQIALHIFSYFIIYKSNQLSEYEITNN